MRVLRFTLLLALALAVVTGGPPAVAQEATPRAEPNAPLGERARGGGGRLDLAAMALTGDDLPAGFALSFEGYVAAADISEQLLGGVVTAEEVERTGLRWFYESQYTSADGQTRIRCYLEEYGTAAGAKAGFELFENEDLFTSPGLSSVDKPGIGVGEEPSELTVSTTEATADAPAGASLDATFRVERLLAGVAIDTVSTTTPSEDDPRGLAETLQTRITAVLDGDDLPGIDSALFTGMLQFEGAFAVQEGYVSLADTYGDAAPPAALDSFESGYVRTVALGMAANPDLPIPIVSVSVSSFAAESGPLAVLSNADALTPAFARLQRERLERIPGASAAIGYSFASPLTSAGPDSFRVMVVVGDRLISIDVQGAASVETAREAAVALAEQQIACMDSSVPCGQAETPPSLIPAAG